MFESIAKTNTTHTAGISRAIEPCLRVLLKQIQHTHKKVDENKEGEFESIAKTNTTHTMLIFLLLVLCLRVLLKQIQHTLFMVVILGLIV